MMPFRYQRYRKKFILFLLIFSLVPLPEKCSLASGAHCNGDSDWSHQMNSSTYLCTPWCIYSGYDFLYFYCGGNHFCDCSCDMQWYLHFLYYCSAACCA